MTQLCEESVVGFSEIFEAEARRLQCHLDISTRASGDCALHGALVLKTLHREDGYIPMGETRAPFQ